MSEIISAILITLTYASVGWVGWWLGSQNEKQKTSNYSIKRVKWGEPDSDGDIVSECGRYHLLSPMWSHQTDWTLEWDALRNESSI